MAGAGQGGASCPNGRDWEILGGSRFRRVFCLPRVVQNTDGGARLWLGDGEMDGWAAGWCCGWLFVQESGRWTRAVVVVVVVVVGYQDRRGHVSWLWLTLPRYVKPRMISSGGVSSMPVETEPYRLASAKSGVTSSVKNQGRKNHAGRASLTQREQPRARVGGVGGATR